MLLLILGLIVLVGALALIFSNFSKGSRSGGVSSTLKRSPNGKVIYLFGSAEQKKEKTNDESEGL